MTIDIDKVGTLACLNSDGLRTLIRTMDIPNMFEKTLRYPGHVEQMRIFMETGFFSMNSIQVKGASARPIDMTASLLSPLWKYEPGEADLTVMRLKISGVEDRNPVTFTYDMCDEYDPRTETLSMAKTTGYTCTAVTKLVLEGNYSRIGISPPEFIGAEEGCWRRVEQYLKERGVRCTLETS